MSDLLIGLIGIAATIFLGLIGIAVGVFIGLKAFQTDIKAELSSIRDKVGVIQQTAQNVWDVIKRSPLAGATGTVERNLKNLGKVKITAEPHLNTTIYYLVSEKAVFDGERIDKLSKETNFEEREKELFGGKVPLISMSTPLPNRLQMIVPCIEPTVCTRYISLFLEWLDSVYFETLPKVEDFEEPIKLTDSN